MDPEVKHRIIERTIRSLHDLHSARIRHIAIQEQGNNNVRALNASSEANAARAVPSTERLWITCDGHDHKTFLELSIPLRPSAASPTLTIRTPYGREIRNHSFDLKEGISKLRQKADTNVNMRYYDAEQAGIIFKTVGLYHELQKAEAQAQGNLPLATQHERLGHQARATAHYIEEHNTVPSAEFMFNTHTAPSDRTL